MIQKILAYDDLNSNRLTIPVKINKWSRFHFSYNNAEKFPSLACPMVQNNDIHGALIVALCGSRNEKFSKNLISVRTDEQETQLSILKERAENSDRLVAQLESDLASAVQGLGQTENLATNDMLNSSTTSKAPDSSLVPILTSQRNRLHERVTSLEETVSLEKTKQLAVQNELEGVRAENIKLVERVRLLQSPNRQSLNNVESGLSNEPVNRNKKMSLHDKTTLQMGRAILANSNTRTAFFAYLIILHVLIMLVLYKFAFDQSVVRDAETECEYKFHQHMMDNHKQ